jgi:ATP phosphoribosyltransferase
MKAAGLIDIDTLVDSTAILIKSKRPSNPAMVELIASRLRGVISTWLATRTLRYSAGS